MRLAIIERQMWVSEMTPWMEERAKIRVPEFIVDDSPAEAGEEGEPEAPVRQKWIRVFRVEDLATPELIRGWWRLPRCCFTIAELRALGFEVRVSPYRAKRSGVMSRASTPRMRDQGQQDALDAALKAGHGILQLAPGRGKTVLALAIAQHFEEPAIVIIDNGGILKQWHSRIKEHLGLTDSQIAIVGGGQGSVQGDWRKAGVVLAMVKSLRNRLADGTLPYSFTEHFGVAVWDEVHHAKARELRETLTLFHARQFGLSATIDTDGTERFYTSHIGEVVYKDVAYDIPPTVHFHKVEIAGAPQWLPGASDSYEHMLRFCTVPAKVSSSANAPRKSAYLDFVCKGIQKLLDAGEKVIVLSQRRRATDYLCTKFPEATAIHGGVPQMLREEMLNRSQLVIVTRKIGEEALDRAELTALVMLTPIGGGAERGLFQSGGRVARQHTSSGKTEASMHVYYLDNEYCAGLAAGMAKMAKSLSLPCVDAPPETRKERKEIAEEVKAQKIEKNAALVKSFASAFARKPLPKPP
jgi:superfamily II DNA or RNA helicase